MPELRDPEALWFGRGHARAASGCCTGPRPRLDRGVVFCNTLGFDGMIAHRALRHLADEIADAGLLGAALRLRRRGRLGRRALGARTGSPRGSRASTPPSASCADRGRHRRAARRLPAGRIAGLPRLDDAARDLRRRALVAVRQRRAHSRGSSKALSRLSTAARPIQQIAADRFPTTRSRSCGFEFSGPALADSPPSISTGCRCRAVDRPCLVIDRADAPASDALIAKLAAAGRDVDHEQMPGTTEFMIDDELTSVLPWPILHRIVDWLDAGTAGLGLPAPHRNGTVEPAVVESPCSTIDDPAAGRYPPPGAARDAVRRGTGVGRRPAVRGRLDGPPARAPIARASIVLCNPGWTKRIGPGRLHVDLARYWASLGFTVVRVDLGGVGDSIGVADADREPAARAPVRIDEVREIVAWVRRPHRFRLGRDVRAVLRQRSTRSTPRLDGVDRRPRDPREPGDVLSRRRPDRVRVRPRRALWAAHALRQGMLNPRKWLIATREPEFLKRGLRRAR